MVLSIIIYLRLICERDELTEDLSATRLELDSRIPVDTTEAAPVTTGIEPAYNFSNKIDLLIDHLIDGWICGLTDWLNSASNHALVEVAESKAKLRKLRQQLEEKTEQLQECREELDKLSETSAKLKAENLELCQDARAAKTYR